MHQTKPKCEFELHHKIETDKQTKTHNFTDLKQSEQNILETFFFQFYEFEIIYIFLTVKKIVREKIM